jgi:crotonobetaine/carnitine-CoA ligase
VDGGASGTGAALADLLASEPLLGAPHPGAEDPVELVYTSGTTSAPKAAVITHANCLFSGRQKADAMELGTGDRLLSALPICHVNAQSALLAALTAGAPFVLLQRYSASRYCERLVAHDATVTSFIGTQVRTMLRQEPGDVDRAHRVRRAWFALNVSASERAAFEQRFAIRLYNGYGLTEAFTSVTQAPLDGPDRWPSVGRALPGREVRIVDPAGMDVPTGEVGEIVVGGVPGRTIMAGYWRDPDATAAALRGGWLHTGDLGRLDGEGYLTFVERKANTIKRAGENIAAGEVERVLLEHPAVAEAAVVGVPDPIRDEAVKAFVVLAEGATTTDEELARHCSERLAPFKVPTLWSVRDELPRNSLGKIEHRRLREEAELHVELSR